MVLESEAGLLLIKYRCSFSLPLFFNNPLFEAHAVALGNLMATYNIRLIYGGSNRGLMGAVANGVLEKGGSVVGIIPQLLNQFETQHNSITELIVV